MSDCGVCLTSDCDGYPEFWSKKTVLARKVHRCSECRRTISVGQKYEYTAMKFDGDFNTFHICSDCVEIATVFYCDGRVLGSLWEDMSDVMSELTTACFNKLQTAEAKAFLRERWMQWKGLAA